MSKDKQSAAPTSALAQQPCSVHAGLAFAGLSVFDVGLAVFTGRMDLLVDHLLICGGKLAQMNRCDLKEMLRERLKPVPTFI